MRALVVALAVCAAAPSAEADCAQDADRLRTHLLDAKRKARRWNLAWGISFASVAALQFTLAATEWNPLGEFNDDFREGLIVGGSKASLGAASHFVLPLKVSIPEAGADRCAELIALRKSVKDLAGREKQSFWLTHLGGWAVNLAGAGILWYRRSLKVGATSVLISLPVGPASAYTMPRATWHLYRDESPAWAVATDLGAGGGR